MTVLPFHYCFGTSLLHTHLRVGGRLVIDNRFMYPETVLQHMASSQCTGFAGVPSHYQILLRRSSIHRTSLPHLRYVQQAGGHLAPALIREFREALPTVKMYVMYGQTEATARLAYVPPEMLDQKLGSIGKAIPGVTLSVINDEGKPRGWESKAKLLPKAPILRQAIGRKRKRRALRSVMAGYILATWLLWTTTGLSTSPIAPKTS